MPPQNFGFPFEKPYPTQLELLKDIYDTIDQNRVGFFESPTGTGKTLTLLCGSLSWLMDYYNKEIVVENQNSISKDDEPDWIKAKRLQSMSEIDVSLRHQLLHGQKKTKLETISNIDEHVSRLVRLLDDDDDDKISKCHESSHSLSFQNSNQHSISPKIFYCSRTHSQLTQVANELRKTKFFTGPNKNKMLNLATSTASRNVLCINKDIRKSYHNSSAINEACNDLISTENGCPYFNRRKEPAFKEHLDSLAARKILDIEDMLKSGTDSQCCPYFSSRHLVQPASLVITPYNTILDKAAREAYGIDLNDSIIIFDEAHNIVDFIKQMNSIRIQNPSDFFDRIVKSIEDYLQKYGKRLRGTNVSALTQLRIFFGNVLNYSQKWTVGESYSVNDFIYCAQIDSFNFSRLINHIEESKLLTKVLFDDLKIDTYQIIGLLRALEAGDCNGRFIILPTELKYNCTNVVNIMSEIVDQCRSVIFCGGTMSPLDDVITQLLTSKLQPKSIAKAIDHYVDSDNINFSILTTGPSGINLNFSYGSRNNVQMINELGTMITNYARIIPAGLVIFFPSFMYMETVIKTWQTKNIFNEIESIKKIFIERKGETSDIMLFEYEQIINSNQGAIILAVMGGKLSEGINFNDDLGRGVITIGLPYPNANEIETIVQIEAYVDAMINSGSGKSRKQLQTEFLENSCMRILNQTIGRVIRHKSDYAAIIMIDERVNRNSIIDKLPKWILPSLSDRSGKFDYSFRSVCQVKFDYGNLPNYFSFSKNGGVPLSLKTMLPPLRRHGKSLFKRFSSSHGHSEHGLHFENHRVEDAMPFNYDNKFTFALKLGAFSAVGLVIPIIGVWWNM